METFYREDDYKQDRADNVEQRKSIIEKDHLPKKKRMREFFRTSIIMQVCIIVLRSVFFKLLGLKFFLKYKKGATMQSLMLCPTNMIVIWWLPFQKPLLSKWRT
jgi:hypothetical protein